MSYQPGQQQPYQPYQQTHLQQQYSQQSSQAPMMQPSQPLKRRSRLWLWITLGIVGVLLFAGIGASVLLSRTNSHVPNTTSSTAAQSTGSTTATTPTTITDATTTTSSPASSTSNSAPQQSSSSTSGQTIVVNTNWTVTLKSVHTSNGAASNTPKPGDIFLIVNVTLKNTSSSTQLVSSLVMFALKDSTGHGYQEDIAVAGTPDGAVVAGHSIRGKITYEVPASMHNFTLQFTPIPGGSSVAKWPITS